MKITPDQLDHNERQTLAQGGWINVTRWRLVFESEQEAEACQQVLEELIQNRQKISG